MQSGTLKELLPELSKLAVIDKVEIITILTQEVDFTSVPV